MCYGNVPNAKNNGYAESVMSRSTVFRWRGQFSFGRECDLMSEINGRPRTTRTDENVTGVTAVSNEHRSAGRSPVEGLNYKNHQGKNSKNMVIFTIIMDDENWCLMKTLSGSVEIRHDQKNCDFKNQVEIVFFYFQRIVHNKAFVPPRSTVNAEFYKNILDRLCKMIACVTPALCKSRYLFYTAFQHTRQ